MELSNGVVELVIAPDLGGRILFYGFVGGPNRLWEAPDLDRQIKRLGGWKNYGGDKAWIWPQERWAEFAGQSWPPPTEFDQDIHTLTHYDDGHVELRSKALDRFGKRRLLRTIRLSSAGTAVTIETELQHPGPDAKNSADTSPPLATWQITQTPRPDVCLIATKDGAKSLQPSAVEGDGRWPAHTIEANDFKFTVIRPPAEPLKQKVKADATAMANLTGDILFVQQWQPTEPNAVVGRDPDRCQLYIDTTPTRPDEHYLEMEWLAPRAGADKQRSAMRVTWTSHSLTPEQRRPAAVAEVLSTLLVSSK